MEIKFTTDGRTFVSALTYFKNEPVCAVAKCSPNDRFDYKIGRRLAEVRCELKVAKKRSQLAEKNLKKIIMIYERIYAKVRKKSKYYAHSVRMTEKLELELNRIERQLK